MPPLEPGRPTIRASLFPSASEIGMELFRHRYIHVSRRAERVLPSLLPEAIESIAVIKHAALGDMVLTRPFFVTLRQHFPNARITLGAVANYMNGLPEDLVDRVHVAAGKFRPRPSPRERFRSYLDLGPHDLIFDLTASNDSYWITALNRAKLKVGFHHGAYARFLYDIAVPRQIFKFEAENFLDQLAVLRLPYEWPLRFDFPRVDDPGGKPGNPYVIYFPTASVTEKCWPPEYYGRLMERMAHAYPGHEHRLVYGVADWEAELTDRVWAEAGQQPGNPEHPGGWAPNLKQVKDATGSAFQALVQQATLVVANDTGIRNLAIAMGTPTLGIFPVSFVNTYLPRFGFHEVVHEPMGGNPTVERVFESAQRLLARIG